MILQLGQRWLTGSTATLPSAFHDGKWFFRALGEYLLTLRTRDTMPAVRTANDGVLALVLDRHGRHGDRLVRQVLRVAGGVGDLVDDVQAFRDLAEDRVVLRQPADEVLVADEELRAVGIRAGVRHRERAPVVVAGERLVLELVAGAAGADAAGVERRLLAELPVAALDHEARDAAVEDHVVVEALLRELDEVAGGLRGAVGEQVGLDRAELGGDD